MGEATTEISSPPAVEPSLAVRKARGRWVAAASWAYAIAVLALLVLIRWVGERWWGVTVLLLAPRWLLLVPVALLMLLAAAVRRPALWVTQATIALVVAWPLMGFSLPVHRLWSRRPQGTTVRVMTYNIRDRKIDVPALLRLLDRERIDVVCFQESVPKSALIATLTSAGWFSSGGGFVVSRTPLVAELAPLESRATADTWFTAHLHWVRLRTSTGVEYRVASVHLPTIREGLYRIVKGDAPGLKKRIDWWRVELGHVVERLAESDETPLIVAGDFNMPADDSSMAALREFLRFGFEDSGWGYGYTRPANVPWVRIDHILSSPHWVFQRSWVGPDFGSDHLPLMAELVLSEAPPKAGRSTK